MDRNANIYFDADEHRFAITDRNGKPDRNRDAFANFLADRDAKSKFDRNGRPNGDANAFFDSFVDAYYAGYRIANPYADEHGFPY
jgi:hypothetical protein